MLETASAAFSLTNGTLTLVLTNTSTFSNYTNGDVLSGVFFAIAGDPILTPIDAVASAPTTCPIGSGNTNCVAKGSVGQNYAYAFSTSGFKRAPRSLRLAPMVLVRLDSAP